MAYATTHNAMSNAEDEWLAPIQTYPVTVDFYEIGDLFDVVDALNGI